MTQPTLADPTDQRSNCGVGVVMDLDGTGGHDVVADALELLANLEHRGTTGAEPNTGDGAGILLQQPREFFADELDVDLPETYAVGQLFLPRDDDARAELQGLVADVLADEGLDCLHWRAVPTDNEGLGATALASEPAVYQCFVAPDDDRSGEAFDRSLYVARRAVEQAVAERAEADDDLDADR